MMRIIFACLLVGAVSFSLWNTVDARVRHANTQFARDYWRQAVDDDTETPAPEDTATPIPEDTETPAIDDTETPAIDDTETPAIDDTETPAIDNTETPAIDDTETPATETAQDDGSETATPDDAIDEETVTATAESDGTDAGDGTDTGDTTNASDETGGTSDAEAIDTTELLTQLHDENATAEQIEQAIDAFLQQPLSQDDVLTLITDTTVLAQATPEQLETVFTALDTQQLDETTKAEISTVMQTAPEAARRVFESEVDLYRSGFNSYVPVGSHIPIETRRALVASTAVTSILAGQAARSRRRK